MNRREFVSAMPLLLVGCGSGDEMAEYTLQPSPGLRNSRQVFGDFGVEGTWTPTISFVLPGDLSVAYGPANIGRYARIGSILFVHLIASFTPTYSTASSGLLINGLPQQGRYATSIDVCAVVQNATLSFGIGPVLTIDQAGTTIKVNEMRSGSDLASMGVTQFPSGTAFSIVGQFFTTIVN